MLLQIENSIVAEKSTKSPQGASVIMDYTSTANELILEGSCISKLSVYIIYNLLLFIKIEIIERKSKKWNY